MHNQSQGSCFCFVSSYIAIIAPAVDDVVSFIINIGLHICIVVVFNAVVFCGCCCCVVGNGVVIGRWTATSVDEVAAVQL